MVADLIDHLRQSPSVRINAGLSENSIASFEARSGAKLPNEFREFYRACDGMSFDDGASQILPLQKVESLKKSVEEFGIRRSWNYVPFTEDNTSNPVCVCCDEPLNGYLVQVFHDDAPVIKWRGLSSLLRVMTGQIDQEEYFFEDAPSEFTTSSRTENDVATARAILTAVQRDGVSEGDRDDGARFAAWLFGEDQVSEISRLLETENEYVRRDVRDRLAALKSRAGSEAMRAYDRSVETFANRCGSLLRGAGIRSEVHEKSRLQVLDPVMWLNLEAFYSERTRPDFDAFFTDRVKHLIEQRRNANPTPS